MAHWTSVEMDFDGNGLPVKAKKYTVKVHVEDVISLMGANETFKDWSSEFTDNSSTVVIGRWQNPMYNRTLGYVQSALITTDASRPFA